MTNDSNNAIPPLIERLAREIVDRNLTAPAIMFLESTKPLSFLGSQIMVFFAPFVKAFWDGTSYDTLTELLEERENVESLLQEIERLEAERTAERKAEKIRKREEKKRKKVEKSSHGTAEKERRLWPLKRKS